MVQMLSTIQEDARPGVEAALEMAKGELGHSLRAAYVLGSLGYGGYVPGWSDIDLDLIVHEKSILGIADPALLGPTLSSRLDQMGFAGVDVRCYTLATLNSPTTESEYGTAVRSVMLLDSAVRVFGQDICGEVVRPTLQVLIREGRGILNRLLSKPPTWWDSLPDDDLAAFMAIPCRILFTAHTGRVVGKSEALEWFGPQYGSELSVDLWPWVAWARACRVSPTLRCPPESVLPTARRAVREFMMWALHRLEQVDVGTVAVET